MRIGQRVFFSVYRDILFFNFFLTSIVHCNLLEVEEHNLVVFPHSMYSLLEAKDRFQLIFQQRKKKKSIPAYFRQKLSTNLQISSYQIQICNLFLQLFCTLRVKAHGKVVAKQLFLNHWWPTQGRRHKIQIIVISSHIQTDQ